MPSIIVVTGAPAWADEISAPEGFTFKQYTDSKRYIYRLTDDRAVMVLVDGDSGDWQTWVAPPKSNNATRRVPIVLITTDKTTRTAALRSGADVAIAPDELKTRLASIITEYANILAPDLAEQLDCECAEELPPLAVQGVEKFNNREFYPQHDLFEEQWVKTEGPVRDLYRAVLQVGVAYYQIERGNHRGALKMLLRAVQWLEALPDVCQTINVAQLKADAYAVRAELERMNPDDMANFDESLLKPVLLVE